MTDNNIAGTIGNLAGVAVMGAVAMKTIDVVSEGSTTKKGRKKKRCKLY
jgi:hypothetical protein